jgi:hypothetical protein
MRPGMARLAHIEIEREHGLGGVLVIDLVADEGAGRSLVDEAPGKCLADLAALGCHVGKAARRQSARGGQQSEHMTAMDHGYIRCRGRINDNDANGIVVKQ